MNKIASRMWSTIVLKIDLDLGLFRSTHFVAALFVRLICFAIAITLIMVMLTLGPDPQCIVVPNTNTFTLTPFVNVSPVRSFESVNSGSAGVVVVLVVVLWMITSNRIRLVTTNCYVCYVHGDHSINYTIDHKVTFTVHLLENMFLKSISIHSLMMYANNYFNLFRFHQQFLFYFQQQ